MKKLNVLALTGAMVAAMSVSALAATSFSVPVVLDPAEADGNSKLVQWNISDFANDNNASIKSVKISYTVEGITDFETDEGWIGGGFGIGYNVSADKDTGWVQPKDPSFTDDARVVRDGDNFVATIDFSTADNYAATTDYSNAEGILQLGCWWTCGDNAYKMNVTGFEVTYDESAPAPADATGDVAPIAFLAAIVAIAGVAMVASKKRA